jgi:hypothetical protein
MTNETCRRLLLIALATWLTGTLAVWWNASNNFRHAGRVFETAQQTGLARKLQPLPAEDARQAMRHLASEINRSIFRSWDRFQAGLALVALWLCWRAGAAPWQRLAVGTALAVALLLAFWITPVVLRLGPPLDFLPRNPPPPQSAMFMRYHAAYLILDGIKMLLLAVVLVAGVKDRGSIKTARPV